MSAQDEPPRWDLGACPFCYELNGFHDDARHRVCRATIPGTLVYTRWDGVTWTRPDGQLLPHLRGRGERT